MDNKPSRASSGTDSPGADTPGRPKESGSRQQTHQNQETHTGSPDLDRELTQRTPHTPTREKPSGTK